MLQLDCDINFFSPFICYNFWTVLRVKKAELNQKNGKKTY